MNRHHGIGGAGALLLALLAVAAPARGASTTILITEVEADPVPIGADLPDEWLELKNVSTQVISLTNWSIADDQSSDVLPSFDLGPDECIVVVADSVAFKAAHPGYAGRLVRVGTIGSGLATAGDRIVLRDPSAAEVDCVSWGTNTTCFSPAIAAPTANTVSTLQRGSLIDTDSSADWTNNTSESPCPGAVGVPERPAPSGGPNLSIVPNPCFGRATISFSGGVQGSIHDAAGRLVRAFRDEGSATFAWDGLDEQGRAVPPGVYLVKVRARTGSGPVATRRLLLLR